MISVFSLDLFSIFSFSIFNPAIVIIRAMSANSGAVPDVWEDSWENQADVRNIRGTMWRLGQTLVCHSSLFNDWKL